MTKTLFTLAAVLLAGSLIAEIQDPTIQPTPEKKATPIPVQREKSQVLRVIHEAFLFSLQRYSMVDATLGAQEQEQDYGHALWLGMGSCVPSVGQFVNKEYLKADALVIGTLVSSQTLKELGPREDELPEGAAKKWVEAIQIMQWGLQSYAMIDAAYTARLEGDLTYDRAFWIGQASLLPGVGQFINHDWWKGGGIFLGFVALERLNETFEAMARKEAWERADVPAARGQFSLLPSPFGCTAFYRTTF